MGHLINPIAFRLGHTRSWEDSWFIKNIYYPEFLHSMLKIRYYMYFFWTTRFMEKKGILFSHLYIYKFIKSLLIKTFLYNTDLEKNIYSFYARGVGIFSDSFYYRYKKKKKKKEPYCYDRYKPDLFLSFFLYYAYFSRRKVKRKKKRTNAFMYRNIKILRGIQYKNKKNENLLDDLNRYNIGNVRRIGDNFLDNLKNGDIHKFFKSKSKKKEFLNRKNSFSNIYAYDNKIKRLNLRKLNLGFLDFFMYIFFKINILYKKEEDLIRSRKKRKSLEMVLNYPLKIKILISLLRKLLKFGFRVGNNKCKRKRSAKNFIFFLIFLMNVIYKVRKKSSRIKFKLRELNLKLVRLFLFNKLLTEFGVFYGTFLEHIVSILTNLRKCFFKFCFITNNSVNARFLTRYMALKLKRKFPLFYVINPLKKELRKLAYKKRDKKKNIILSALNYKYDLKKIKINFKYLFKSVLNLLLKKYDKTSIFYYKKFKTFVTFDFFPFFFLIKKKKEKSQTLSIYLKEVFFYNFRQNIWKNKRLNRNWIFFIIKLVKNKKSYKLFVERKKIINIVFNFLKNKLLINLLYGLNKYHIDNLISKLFELKGRKDTFFMFNTNYYVLLVYTYFYSHTFTNYNITQKVNIKYLTLSNYFFKSYMFYLHVVYSFNKLIDYFNINKRKNYLRTKDIYKPTSYFLGFKMSFKGRFTRKQRASSVWFHQGFVPLNTVKGFIDYSFFTIPLKNSAISVKLWLYKNRNDIIWDSKFINKRM